MISIHTNAPVPVEAVQEVFRSSGIKRPIDDPVRIAAMLKNANLIVSARDGERVVGIARALTDFSYCCYLSDLAVSAEYQRRGVGKMLVDAVKEQIGRQCMLLLLSAPGAMGYYPQLGFSKVENGWIIPRSS